MSILEKFENFLLKEIAADLGKESLSPDEDLLEQGIIDSMGIMSLTSFMQGDFGIKVEDEEIVPENFQCLNSMVRFVEHKMQNK